MAVGHLIEAFDTRANACVSDAELAALLADVLAELGFDHFALLHHASLRQGGGAYIRLDTYPGGWVDELVETGLALEDPVHLASARTHLGFAWDQLPRLVPMTGRRRAVLERSARHGIGEGFTVPANVPGEPGGSCSFAVRRGRALPRRHLLAAELIGARAFGAARRLRGYPRDGQAPRLSRRELQCLRLVAAGKSNWEIGRLLGISEATASHYVKRARAAYDVASRAQLVVHGLRDGQISFDDASPPTGGLG